MRNKWAYKQLRFQLVHHIVLNNGRKSQQHCIKNSRWFAFLIIMGNCNVFLIMSTSFDQKAIIMNFRIKGGGGDSDQGGGCERK